MVSLLSTILCILILLTVVDVLIHTGSMGNTMSMGKYTAIRSRYVYDETLIFRRRPSTVIDAKTRGDLYQKNDGIASDRIHYQAQYDALGFRNTHLKSNESIALIGDSFVEYGIDQTDLLGTRISAFIDAQVANYGTGHYGPYQYLELLQK